MLEDIVRQLHLDEPLHDSNPGASLAGAVRTYELQLRESDAGGRAFGAYCDARKNAALLPELARMFGDERAQGMMMALAEGIANYHSHGYEGYDPGGERRIDVSIATDGHMAYATIRANSRPWSPPCGIARGPAPMAKRGWGHALMASFSDFLAYGDSGRELHLGWYPVEYAQSCGMRQANGQAGAPGVRPSSP